MSRRSTPGKDPVPIVLEAGWAPGPVWTGAENKYNNNNNNNNNTLIGQFSTKKQWSP
jgi:hypothetical protein